MLTDRFSNGRSPNSRIPGNAHEQYLQQIMNLNRRIEWDYPITPSNRFLASTTYSGLFPDLDGTTRDPAYRGNRAMHSYIRATTTDPNQQNPGGSSYQSHVESDQNRGEATVLSTVDFTTMFAEGNFTGWDVSYFTESDESETESVEEDDKEKKSSQASKDPRKQTTDSDCKLKENDQQPSTQKAESEDTPKTFRWVHIVIV